MFNKMVYINRIIAKFVAFVSYAGIILCTNIGKKRKTFLEVTLKSERTRDRLMTVLYLRHLGLII